MLLRGIRTGQLAGACVAASVLGGGVLKLVAGFETAGNLMLILAALAGARLVTQVQVSQLNARGLQRAAAKGLSAGLVTWAGAATWLWLAKAEVWEIAVAQVLIEGLVAVLLVAAGARSSLFQRGGPRGERTHTRWSRRNLA